MKNVRPVNTWTLVCLMALSGLPAGRLLAVDPVDLIATSYPPVVQGDTVAVEVDASGNRYICGSFSGTLDFKPVAGADCKTADNNGNAFITRYNADGTYAWTTTFGGNGSDSGAAITIIGTTVYLAGNYGGANTGVNGTGSLNKLGTSTCFVLALNADTGAAVTTFGNAGVQIIGSTGYCTSSALTATGTTLYLCGGFEGSNFGIGQLGSRASSGGFDAFVAALDASTGAAVTGFGVGGIQIFGGTNNDGVGSIAVSGDNVYACGSFLSTDFGIGGVSNSANAGNQNSFALALNVSTGAAVTGFANSGVLTFGGSAEDELYGLALSGTSLYLTGYVGSTDAKINGAGSLTNAGGGDLIVIAVNKNTGALVSGFGSGGVKTFGGSNYDSGRAMAASATTLYVAGKFDSSSAGFGGSGTLNTAGGSDALILALNPETGAPVSGFYNGGAQSFGGASFDIGRSIAVFGSKVYMAGAFASTDAGVGGTGAFDSTNFGGFLLELDGAAPSSNSAPTFISTPTASPVAANVGQSVTFTAAVTDSDADALTVTWDYKDGSSTATGLQTTHSFGTADTYNVTATVSDGTVSTSATVVIVVSAVPPGALTIAKGTVKFTFASSTKDQLSLSGTIPLPAGFVPNGKVATVQIGTISKVLTFVKTTAGDKDNSFKLTAKLDKASGGIVQGNIPKFVLSLKKQKLFDALTGLGFTNETIKANPVNLPVSISFASGPVFTGSRMLSYTAKVDKAGSGK